MLKIMLKIMLASGADPGFSEGGSESWIGLEGRS